MIHLKGKSYIYGEFIIVNFW